MFDQDLLDQSPFRNGNNPGYTGSKPNCHDQVRVHLFEHTVRVHEDENYNYYYPPLQIIFALKENNAGKLDSHLWYFNAFSKSLKPDYCVVILNFILIKIKN